ncbi:MAG: Transglycosylase domain protein [Pseudonocardiales bacterium]|nr:Transglycosylase domain protein [Pseudonocardiales bacterium]
MPGTRRISRRLRRSICVLTLSGGAAAALALSLPSSASADPSANDWYRLRMCESSNNYTINTGNGYYGAYQFNLSTWQGVGGIGYPNQASPAEQDARALKLYRLRGWQPWTCAGIVGLQEDADARSGRVNDIQFPPAGGTVVTPTPTVPVVAPAWPGPQYFSIGDHSDTIAQFQAQLHARGSYLVGDGNFGPNTQAEVKRIQAQNGLSQTGILGPVTWKLAWSGTYNPGSAPAGGIPVAVTPATATPIAVAVPAVAGSAPSWPGPQYYSIGDHSDTIAQFQAQLHSRGSFLVGDGNFGPNTQAAVKQLQALNGLPQTGILGPVTWKLAWAGTWTNIAPV